MKTSLALATLGLAPVFGHAVGLQWSLDRAPQSGLNDIVFPLDFTNAAHIAGYEYAVEFSFANARSTATTVAFRTGSKNATSVDTITLSSPSLGLLPQQPKEPNCERGSGSDGRNEQVHCLVMNKNGYHSSYNLAIKRMAPSTWVATLKDVRTGITTHIGSFNYAQNGNIATNGNMYINAVTTCNKLRSTEVAFGGPTSQNTNTDYGFGSVQLENRYLFACGKKSDVKASTVGHGGLQVKVLLK
ncbi:hypothetical protein NLG97_g5491 [Lecanicillium saksenae]|uniref:Uncharacterized protein n=1 Tax=Lecanicillium saksenae TaxID=468837 RepID=A0ACC1QVI5_9HYPO|nr:hypothetical protein NLG97_g5491 [Lecanicillium saksenae]